MAGFGQLVPGMASMAIPQMQSGGLGPQGMSILKAALAQQSRGAPSGAPGAPVAGAPMNIAPPGAGGAAGGPPGLLGMLMSKMRGSSGPIDPNSGLPVTQDVLNGAAQPGLPNMGGAGPAPTAITGLW